MTKGKWLFTCLSLILVGFLLFSSGPVFAQGNSGGEKTPLEKARDGLEREVAGQPGYAGIAYSEEEGVITVFLENEQAKGNVPDSFAGFSVRKLVTGRFKAIGPVKEAIGRSVPNQVSSTRTGVVRPLVGGISLSANIDSYAGTLGMITYPTTTGAAQYILSNAHVIAMNPGTTSFLPPGTAVVQPGTYEGGTANIVGALQTYIPITFNSITPTTPNYADAATANITSTITGSSGVQFSENGNYTVSGNTTVAIGDIVRKSGRTSGVTTNSVLATNANVSVYYTNTDYAYFTDQIIVNQPFIQAGDSGSCVDKGGCFVGLAFAASNTQAVVCKASHIIDGLGISVGATPTPDFSLSTNPTTISFTSGGSSTFNVSITPSGGFADNVTLTTSTPANITVTPTSATVAGPPYATTNFTVTSSTPGTYTVIITGTSGTLMHQTSVTVTVKAPALSVMVSTDKGSYRVGQTATIMVTVTSAGSPVNGAAVAFSIKNRFGNTVKSGVGTTSAGTVQFTWNTRGASRGTYTVQASASKSGYTSGSGSTTFTLR